MAEKQGKATPTKAKAGQAVAVKQGAVEPARSFEERFEDMERMMDRMFEGFLPSRWLGPLAGWSHWPAAMPKQRVPAADLVEREKDILVRAEMPGVSKDDINISINGNLLQIEGRSRHEEKQEEGAYKRREITTSAFSRSLMLPAEVDVEGTKATLKDGVLELTLPKTAAPKAKKIAIEQG